MKFKQRIKTNKRILSEIIDEILREDIIHKVVEIDAKITGELNDASKASVYLEGIDRAYSMAFLNLKLITYIEKCYKSKDYDKENFSKLESLLNDTTESINLLIKYLITQKMQYKGEEFSGEGVENIVYYSDIKEHMRIPRAKIKQLNF